MVDKQLSRGALNELIKLAIMEHVRANHDEQKVVAQNIEKTIGDVLRVEETTKAPEQESAKKTNKTTEQTVGEVPQV